MAHDMTTWAQGSFGRWAELCALWRLLIAVSAIALLAACAAPGSPPSGVGKSWYHPQDDAGYDAVGIASWYGAPYHGCRTASGQIYNMHAATAAHPTLAFGTRVRVTNLTNGRSIVLTINDRGPFTKGRIVDVSRHAAEQLRFVQAGTARVRVQALESPRG